MLVKIDGESGFCFGVVKAIEKAEEELGKKKHIYCLGDIVHNEEEVNRLNKMGLKVITHEEFSNLKNAKVLIRAHGEPPSTYEIANKNNIELVDATCPVVLKLQQRIKTACEDVEPVYGQLVIFGKEGHAEVNGLFGQTKYKGIIVRNTEDIEKIDFNLPVRLFSQTTMPKKDFVSIAALIEKRMRIAQGKDDVDFIAKNTVCGRVSGREPILKEFAQKYDVIIFVSGKKSSNGRVLFRVCKENNEKSYMISNSDELDVDWFVNANSVGVCGATSTPLWLMEKIAKKIKNKFPD